MLSEIPVKEKETTEVLNVYDVCMLGGYIGKNWLRRWQHQAQSSPFAAEETEVQNDSVKCLRLQNGLGKLLNLEHIHLPDLHRTTEHTQLGELSELHKEAKTNMVDVVGSRELD